MFLMRYCVMCLYVCTVEEAKYKFPLRWTITLSIDRSIKLQILKVVTMKKTYLRLQTAVHKPVGHLVLAMSIMLSSLLYC